MHRPSIRESTGQTRTHALSTAGCLLRARRKEGRKEGRKRKKAPRFLLPHRGSGPPPEGRAAGGRYIRPIFMQTEEAPGVAFLKEWKRGWNCSFGCCPLFLFPILPPSLHSRHLNPRCENIHGRKENAAAYMRMEEVSRLSPFVS